MMNYTNNGQQGPGRHQVAHQYRDGDDDSDDESDIGVVAPRLRTACRVGTLAGFVVLVGLVLIVVSVVVSSDDTSRGYLWAGIGCLAVGILLCACSVTWCKCQENRSKKQYKQTQLTVSTTSSVSVIGEPGMNSSDDALWYRDPFKKTVTRPNGSRPKVTKRPFEETRSRVTRDPIPRIPIVCNGNVRNSDANTPYYQHEYSSYASPQLSNSRPVIHSVRDNGGVAYDGDYQPRGVYNISHDVTDDGGFRNYVPRQDRTGLALPRECDVPGHQPISWWDLHSYILDERMPSAYDTYV